MSLQTAEKRTEPTANELTTAFDQIGSSSVEEGLSTLG
ncbi:hypothetical protein IWX63_003029 [Arthrobacter sp. CAN_A2]